MNERKGRAIGAFEEHFARFDMCKVRLYSRDSTIEKDWYADVQLRPNRIRKRANRYAGAAIERVGRETAILLYFWVRGGRAAEEALVRKLGSIVRYRSSEVGWDAGSVVVGEIPIMFDKPNSFAIRIEPLLEKVRDELERIDRKRIRLFVQFKK